MKRSPHIPAVEVGPENSARSLKLARFEQELGVYNGHIIRIQEENFPERGMANGIRLEFPAFENAGGMFSAEFKGVDTFDVQRRQERFHFSVEFPWPKVP